MRRARPHPGVADRSRHASRTRSTASGLVTAIVLVSVALTLGTMALTGAPMTGVTSVLGTFLLVVGMAGNPHCRKARRALDAAGLAHQYLEFGSYLSQWRRRNALKMWTGWPTFPMVFVKGTLVGGADDVAKLIASGELQRLLA